MTDIVNQNAHFNSASDGALKALDELRGNAFGDRRQGCSRPRFKVSFS
jgi:hypothetical protein